MTISPSYTLHVCTCAYAYIVSYSHFHSHVYHAQAARLQTGEQYEVDKIVDFKEAEGETPGMYKVRWTGYGSDADTWEVLDDFDVKAKNNARKVARRRNKNLAASPGSQATKKTVERLAKRAQRATRGTMAEKVERRKSLESQTAKVKEPNVHITGLKEELAATDDSLCQAEEKLAAWADGEKTHHAQCVTDVAGAFEVWKGGRYVDKVRRCMYRLEENARERVAANRNDAEAANEARMEAERGRDAKNAAKQAKADGAELVGEFDVLVGWPTRGKVTRLTEQLRG